MNIEINIVCEDEREFLAHLSVIRQEVKREIKKQEGELKIPATLRDNNCYGDHTVNIIPDCTEQSGHFPDGNGFCLSCGDQLARLSLNPF
jgi:hypothetical protein